MAYHSSIGIADLTSVPATARNTPTDSVAILPNGYEFTQQIDFDWDNPRGDTYLMTLQVYDPVHHVNVAEVPVPSGPLGVDGGVYGVASDGGGYVRSIWEDVAYRGAPVVDSFLIQRTSQGDAANDQI